MNRRICKLMKKKNRKQLWNLLKFFDLHSLPLLFLSAFSPASFDFFDVQFVLILFVEFAKVSNGKVHEQSGKCKNVSVSWITLLCTRLINSQRQQRFNNRAPKIFHDLYECMFWPQNSNFVLFRFRFWQYGRWIEVSEWNFFELFFKLWVGKYFNWICLGSNRWSTANTWWTASLFALLTAWRLLGSATRKSLRKVIKIL